MITKNELNEFLRSLAANVSPQFTGLGLILYRSADELPITPLGSKNSALRAGLPVIAREDVLRTLLAVADRSSECHDGFHLLDAGTGALTHLAQFVSPPLDAAKTNFDASPLVGARQMAALLTSKLPQVAFTAIVAVGGKIYIYEDGALQNTGNE